MNARKPQGMAVPRSGAFAATTGEPEAGSVLAEVVADAVAAQPPAPDAEPEAPAAAAPAGPRTRRPRRRGGVADAPLPSRLAETDKMVPLQVKVPQQSHWRLKTSTTLLASNMTRVVTALLSVYNEDPELGEALIELAERRRISLGEMLHDLLQDAAAGGTLRDGDQ